MVSSCPLRQVLTYACGKWDTSCRYACPGTIHAHLTTAKRIARTLRQSSLHLHAKALFPSLRLTFLNRHPHGCNGGYNILTDPRRSTYSPLPCRSESDPCRVPIFPLGQNLTRACTLPLLIIYAMGPAAPTPLAWLRPSSFPEHIPTPHPGIHSAPPPCAIYPPPVIGGQESAAVRSGTYIVMVPVFSFYPVLSLQTKTFLLHQQQNKKTAGAY